MKMPNLSKHLAGDELSDRVQANLIAYHRLFAGLPGITVVEDDIVFIASRGFPGSLVLGTRFPDEAIEHRIDESLSEIGRRTDSIDWFVFPSCQPTDLGNRLAEHGHAGRPDSGWRLFGKVGGRGGIWMLGDLATLSDGPSVPPGFRVDRVSEHAQLEQWALINAEGFGGDYHQIIYDAFVLQGFGRGADLQNYVGFVADEPVTSATLFLAGGIASIYNVSTPESLRRQGFGGAITHAALREAPGRGYQTAFIQSSELGKNVYGSLGFVVRDFGIREYQWHKQ